MLSGQPVTIIQQTCSRDQGEAQECEITEITYLQLNMFFLVIRTSSGFVSDSCISAGRYLEFQLGGRGGAFRQALSRPVSWASHPSDPEFFVYMYKWLGKCHQSRMYIVCETLCKYNLTGDRQVYQDLPFLLCMPTRYSLTLLCMHTLLIDMCRVFQSIQSAF